MMMKKMMIKKGGAITKLDDFIFGEETIIKGCKYLDDLFFTPLNI